MAPRFATADPGRPRRPLRARALLLLLLAGGGAPLLDPPVARATETGFPSLDLTGPDGPINLLGQPAVVNLWASWCGPCLTELPAFDRLAARLAGEAKVVAVSVDTAWGPVRGVVARLGLTLPLAHDPRGSLPRALAAPGLPATYVLDAEGRIRSARLRALSAAEIDALETQVRALLAP